MSILDDLPDVIAEAMDDVFRDGVLKVPGEPSSDGQGGWIPGAPTSHPCKALVDDYSDMRRATAGIPAHDRKIIILAASLSVAPAVGHTITAEGRDWQIVALTRDPAKATWEVQGALMAIVTINLAALERIAEEKAVKGIERAALAGEEITKANLSRPGTGRIYGKHQASAPGEPPAVDTGRLRNATQPDTQVRRDSTATDPAFTDLRAACAALSPPIRGDVRDSRAASMTASLICSSTAAFTLAGGR